MYIPDHPPRFNAPAGLRPIGQIVAGLLPKLIVRFHINEAMNATAPVDAVEAFVTANGIRELAGLTWTEALSDINYNRRDRGAA